MGAWVDRGFANAALWSAISSGLWKSQAFESLLYCPNIDLDEPSPAEKSSNTGEAKRVDPSLSDILNGEKRKFSFSPLVGSPPSVLPNHPLQDRQMQLMLLEQQNKRRLMQARMEALEWRVGKSPVAWAAMCRNVQLVEILLRTSRVNVNSQDAEKRTPLMQAITVKSRQTVEKLLGTGNIDLNMRDDEGRTAIFHAAQGGDLHIIQLLTETKKVDFSIRDCNGESVQDIALKNGKREVIAALAT